MSDRREGRRRGLRPWHVIPGIVGVLILAVILWFFVQSNRAQSQLRALRAQGEPTSYAEWSDKHRLAPGVANAADSYDTAFQVYFKPDHDAVLPYVGRTKLPDLGEPLSETMVAEIEKFLAKNEETLKWLREARGIEPCHYDWDPRHQIPEMAQLRACVQLLATAAMLRAQQGDVDGALGYVDDALQMGRSVRNEPGLVCYFLRQACIGMSVSVLERILNTATFTDVQLVKADRMLDQAVSTMDLSKAWVGERCGLIECIEDPSLLGNLNNIAMKVPGLRTVGMVDTLDYMGDCIEASKLPPLERTTRLEEIFDGLNDLSPVHIVARVVAPPLGRMAQIDLRCRVGVGAARMALAIERYRLATGSVPEEIGTLVPDYLHQVPIDFFDGQPIRYKRTEPGYILYSIGDDGQDNEGKGREQVDRGEPYDWPFVMTK